MIVSRVQILLKFAKKNMTLLGAVNEFVNAVQGATWNNDQDVKATFPNADRIFNNVYVFNITGADRSLALVFFKDGEVEIVWAGNHDEYDATLKNNKDTIRKFLRKKGYDI
jgi:mRNA interferase HigB